MGLALFVAGLLEGTSWQRSGYQLFQGGQLPGWLEAGKEKGRPSW